LQDEGLGVNGLRDHRGEAAAAGLRCIIDIETGRDAQDRHRREMRLPAAPRGDGVPIEIAADQLQITHNEVGRGLPELGERRAARGHGRDGMPRAFKEVAEELTMRGVVFHDHDPCWHDSPPGTILPQVSKPVKGAPRLGTLAVWSLAFARPGHTSSLI
jgi:hypothetical protein